MQPLTQSATILLLCATMGLFGQGVRVIVGLKKAGRLSQADTKSTFDAAFMLISLMIGAIAGIAVGFMMGIIDPSAAPKAFDTAKLLSIAAAGYAGADFVENTAGLVINRATQGNTPSTGVSFLNSQYWVETGKTLTLAPSFTPENATNKTGKWSSEDNTVATVDPDSGLITGIAAGTTNISFVANDSGNSAITKITIK
ncbi:MAG: Ig-like domain-containing protein [Scandinavium sp.]|uniref:Ig-like domain-containing protein n=1 Tax=Scandinavium sp. TaxID=2830653 RepID=UPI003F309202